MCADKSNLEQAWAEKILAGDRRATGRAISRIENGDPVGIALLKLLFPNTGRAYVIGVTGTPGAGKSTLVEKLAGEYRSSSARVGIVAVDPTSPFSGGAILGDRIRMQRHSIDEGIYIRSMATRGKLGGLAPTTHDVVTVLDAARYDPVIIETVGVGQDEVDVARLADVTVLLVIPGMGDEVQTFKAGIMEVADIFVINKADRPGADRVEREVRLLLSQVEAKNGWTPPIIKTIATTGEGIRELREALDQFQTFGNRNSLKLSRKREHWRVRLLEMLRQRLLERITTERLQDGEIDRRIDEIIERKHDPHTVVDEILDRSGLGRAHS